MAVRELQVHLFGHPVLTVAWVSAPDTEGASVSLGIETEVADEDSSEGEAYGFALRG